MTVSNGANGISLTLFAGYERNYTAARLADFERGIQHLQHSIDEVRERMKSSFDYLWRIRNERNELVAKGQLTPADEARIKQIDADDRYLVDILNQTKPQDLLETHETQLRSLREDYDRLSPHAELSGEKGTVVVLPLKTFGAG